MSATTHTGSLTKAPGRATPTGTLGTLDEGMAEAAWEARKLSARELDLEPGSALADGH